MLSSSNREKEWCQVTPDKEVCTRYGTIYLEERTCTPCLLVVLSLVRHTARLLGPTFALEAKWSAILLAQGLAPRFERSMILGGLIDRTVAGNRQDKPPMLGF